MSNPKIVWAALAVDDELSGFMDPSEGDHLVSPRGVYSHHGIYIGRGRVIHYAGLATGLSKGSISETSLGAFKDGNPCYVRRRFTGAFSSAEIIARAKSRLGENAYSIYSNNCEHFCEWCITGRPFSHQVDVGSVVVTGILEGASLFIAESLSRRKASDFFDS